MNDDVNESNDFNGTKWLLSEDRAIKIKDSLESDMTYNYIN